MPPMLFACPSDFASTELSEPLLTRKSNDSNYNKSCNNAITITNNSTERTVVACVRQLFLERSFSTRKIKREI